MNRKKFISIMAGIMAAVMLLGLLLGLFASAVSAAGNQSSSQIKQEITELEKEQEKMEQQLSDLKNQINSNLDEIDGIMDRKDLVEQQISLLNEQIRNANQRIAAYATLIADKQVELAEAEAHLKLLNEQNKERIRAMEEGGEYSYWSILLQAKNFSDLLDRLKMVQEIALSDQRRLEQMDAAAKRVAAAKAALVEEQKALQASKDGLALKQQEQEGMKAEVAELLNLLIAKGDELELKKEEFEEALSDAEQKLAELEHDYKVAIDREEEEKRLNQYLSSNGGGVVTDSNGIRWVIPCHYLRVTSRFGYRTHPITGEKGVFHKGIDLSSPCYMQKDGTTKSPIYASRGGVVIRAREGETEGWFVTIDHGDGYRTVYMHMCCKPFVNEGQTVYAGDVIGCIGTTGSSTGNHLHFGISYNGTYVNPANYIGIGK